MLFTQGLPSLNSIKKKLSELGVIQIIVGKLFNELSSPTQQDRQLLTITKDDYETQL